MSKSRIAIVYGVPLGPGGLAVQVGNAITALAEAGDVEVHALGPKASAGAALDARVRWHEFPGGRPAWSRARGFRAFQGAAQYAHDAAFGRWAAARLSAVAPTVCYAFTQVGLECLRFCKRAGIPTILESPNGHLRDFRAVYVSEQERWCGGTYRGHPNERMVARVEEEYALADRVRASSQWTLRSLQARGVGAEIAVLQQPLDVDRYQTGASSAQGGPLRVVFVGTLDLRKGFVYLLQAVRRMDHAVSLELVGGTVDRCTRALLERERTDLDVVLAPGNPLAAYHRAEVSVLPSLEDGSPFAAAEAMSCGLPLVITDSCGAAEWVENDRTGWIVASRSVDALEQALHAALRRRSDLAAMGHAARAATVSRADAGACNAALRDWVFAGI